MENPWSPRKMICKWWMLHIYAGLCWSTEVKPIKVALPQAGLAHHPLACFWLNCLGVSEGGWFTPVLIVFNKEIYDWPRDLGFSHIDSRSQLVARLPFLGAAYNEFGWSRIQISCVFSPAKLKKSERIKGNSVSCKSRHDLVLLVDQEENLDPGKWSNVTSHRIEWNRKRR